MLKLEENHPGTRHSIMAGYEELASLASSAQDPDDEATPDFGECERCGAPDGTGPVPKVGLLETRWKRCNRKAAWGAQPAVWFDGSCGSHGSKWTPVETGAPSPSAASPVTGSVTFSPSGLDGPFSAPQ